jgi:hypothetical protein
VPRRGVLLQHVELRADSRTLCSLAKNLRRATGRLKNDQGEMRFLRTDGTKQSLHPRISIDVCRNMGEGFCFGVVLLVA